MSEYSDQYPRRRKRHKGKYLELIYAFIANIVPHARLSPIGHTSFLCMKLDSIDISYFLFTIRPLFHSPAERKWKSRNFLSVVNSRECFNERSRHEEKTTPPLLPISYNRTLKKTGRSLED